MTGTTVVGTTPPRVVRAARRACAVLAVLVALGPGLLYLFVAALTLLFLASDDVGLTAPYWDEAAFVGQGLLLAAVVVSLAVAARRLDDGGRRGIQGWRAGLLGAGLIVLAGVALALAPLTDEGQDWMPELLVGGVVMAVGAGLLALLLHPGVRGFVTAAGGQGR